MFQMFDNNYEACALTNGRNHKKENRSAEFIGQNKIVNKRRNTVAVSDGKTAFGQFSPFWSFMLGNRDRA
jgi:hypothetical protein